MDMLLKEERIIREIVGQFGCISREQGIKTLYYKEPAVADNIIRNLLKKQYLFEKTEGYITVTPNNSKDIFVIDAYWTFLYFVNRVGLDNFYPASHPSQISFIDKNTQYEITSISSNDYHIVKRVLSDTCKAITAGENTDVIRHIFAVRSKADMAECKKRIPPELLNKKMILFATLNYTGSDASQPELRFLTV